MQTAMDRWTRSRWWLPLFCLLVGGVVFAAFAIGGDPGEGLFGFAVVGRAWPGVPDRRRPQRDARRGAWLYEIADGRDGNPTAGSRHSAASPTSWES